MTLQSLFADILSVLAMTYSDTQPRGTLRYRLLAASLRPSTSPLSDPGEWGHEYVRHLASELGEEFTLRETGEIEVISAPAQDATPADAAKPDGSADGTEKDVEAARQEPLKVGTLDDLRSLAVDCAKFLLGHNAEPDAVDLLEEMEIVDRLVELVDENTFARVCAYMIAYVSLMPFSFHCLGMLIQISHL